MPAYDDLLAELSALEPLAKAAGADKGEAEGKADDKKIAAAAAEGDKADCDGDGDADDKQFGKAFSVTLADGTQAEAFDGTEMLKALHTTADEHAEKIEDLQKAFSTAIGVIKDLRQVVTEQAEMLKAYGAKTAQVASSGTGRRTMVAIAEKLTPMAAAEAAKPTGAGVMMKAQQMCRAGSLGWEALPRIEAFQGRGQLAPPDLLARFPELLTPVS
jgi:hypothetical protein